MSCKSIKVWWSSLLEHCPKWGKDDGDYDSPTSQDETSDFIKKRGQRAHQIKKIKKRGQRSPQKKKKKDKNIWEKKRERTMLLSFFHTCASK